MNSEQALDVLEQALNIANKKGAFELKDSAVILTALNVLKLEFPKTEEIVEEIKSNPKSK